MSRQIIVSEHMSMVALLALAVLTLAGCGGGSSGGSVSRAPVSVPRSMTHPPVTLDPIQPRWFQIIYAPTLASAKPMLLNVQGASLLGGTQLILYPQQANALNEAWQFTQVGSSGSTSYGYFTSGLGDYPYNPYTNKSNPAQPLVLSASGNNAVTYPSQAGTNEGGGDKFQLWSFQPSCSAASCSPTSILNQLTGTSVYVSSSSQDTPVTLRSGTSNQWAYWPPRQLQDILDEPNDPYPQYSGDQLTQYDYISCNAEIAGLICANNVPVSAPCTLEGQSFNGIRCEYVNLAAPLSIYAAVILDLQPASGSTASQIAAFNQVKKQLVTELTNAETVQTLYGDYSNFYTDLFINGQGLLNQMIADAGLSISSSNQVSGRTIAIIEGVLKAAVTVAAGLASGGLAIGVDAIGDLTETAIGAALQKGSVSETPFQVAVSNLWSTLNTDFNNILIANGGNEMTVLQDFRRSSTVGALATGNGPDSLKWYSGSDDLVTALEPGFEVAAMQMLMPAKYSVQVNPQVTQGDFVGGYSPPSWDTYVAALGYGVWTQFYIGNIGSEVELPSQQAMHSDIFGNGVAPIQFFNNLNGWKFNYVYNDGSYTWYTVGAAGCNSLIVSITNDTPDTVTLSATMAEHDGYLFGTSPRTLGPYATNVFGLQTEDLHGPDFNFGISGPNGSASFNVQQDYCFSQAGDVSYTNQGTSGQYQLSNLGDTTGSEANDTPGIQRVAVYNPSASQ